jgi:hypothetical protein
VRVSAINASRNDMLVVSAKTDPWPKRARAISPQDRQLLAARRLQRLSVGAHDAPSQRETPSVARRRNYRE